MGELKAVAKCAAGGNDGIAKAERADGNAQVNISRRTRGIGSAWGSHFVQEGSTKGGRARMIREQAFAPENATTGLINKPFFCSDSRIKRNILRSTRRKSVSVTEDRTTGRTTALTIWRKKRPN